MIWAAGVAGPVLFIASWVTAGMLREGYDPTTHAISRLAAFETPDRWIVTAGIVAFGIGAVIFGLGIRRHIGSGAGLALVAAGLTSFAVAVFPCTKGCPGPGDFTDTAHVIAAGAHYVAFTLAVLLAGRENMRRSGAGYRTFCFMTGGLAALALSAQGLGMGPNGLMQRIGLTLNDFWMIVTALMLWRRARPRAVKRIVFQPTD